MSTSGTEVADDRDALVPDDPTDVPTPRYGRASLADLVPGVLAHLTADRDQPLGRDVPAITAELTGHAVVVLVVDGLGALQLAAARDAAPLLTSLPGDDVDAVFPTTTSANLTSIGTGLPPSQHGVVGYSFPVPHHEHPLNALAWRIGLRGGGFDARHVLEPAPLVPEVVVPGPTAFEVAAEGGIATTVVVDPDFPDSGLTRAGLRGGQRRSARGLGTVLATALDAVEQADGPALVYAHHPLVDWAGHTEGPGSDAWREAVLHVDRTLQEVRDLLPDATTLLVTADHGMLDVPDRHVTELADHPELLEGVRTLAGEPRVRHLALEDGVDAATVAARWRDVLGERALVVPRSVAMPWFGPDPSATGRAHVGDLVVLARRGTLVHERVDPHGGRHRGQHGGPTRAERLVPLRHLTRDP